MDKLKEIKSLREQVDRFIYYVQGPSPGVHSEKCARIVRDLYEALRRVYPNCRIHQFGSSYTGLCFTDSDLDIYVSQVRRPNQGDFKHLYRLRNLLDSSRMFHNLLVIGQAKIPILKCVHSSTNTNCDINIRNMLGLCNSRLIAYYLNVDTKLRQMMLIIKYWAKIHRITGQNHLFTNYSLCMMVIFYLQGNPYNLPSVKYLQTHTRPDKNTEPWNGYFNPAKTFCPHVKSSSLQTLLSNFFSYYAEFDYATYVICPFLGQPIKKTDFCDPDNLPAGYETYKSLIKSKDHRPLRVDAGVCVQDPFEHTRNVTPIVSESTVGIFVKFCELGKRLTEENEQGVLYKLFTRTPPNAIVELLTQANFIQFGVLMGPKSDETTSTDEYKDLWFESVKNFNVIVLRDIFNMTVEEEDPMSSKRQKKDCQSDVCTALNNVIGVFKCSASLNLWFSRPKPKQQCRGGVVEREMDITKTMLEAYKDIDKTTIVEFKMVLEKRVEPAQVVFNLSKIKCYKKVFRSFGQFFANKFVKWFELYEKESNGNVIEIV